MSKTITNSAEVSEQQLVSASIQGHAHKHAKEQVGCAICGNIKDTSRCSACWKVSYCSRAHQKVDWKLHKANCLPMEVRIDKEGSRGRYLVATRPIAQGQIFCKEKPLIWGPTANNQRRFYPICLSCTHVVRGSYKCSSCRWPVCGESCEKDSTHTQFECQMFSKRGVRPTNLNQTTEPQFLFDYSNVNVFRALMMKLRNPGAWNSIQQLFSHGDERSQDLKALLHTNAAIKFIQDDCGLGEQFNADIIREVSGIIQVNAMGSDDTPTLNPLKLFRSATYLYSTGSFMTHSCSPNIMRIIQSDGRLLFKATVPIGTGQTITTTYCDIMQGTAVRRSHLESNYYFACNCPRCADPTEMGTHFSSVKCGNCTIKHAVGYLLPTDPLDTDSDWKCTECRAVQPAELVRRIVCAVQTEHKAVPYADSLEALEQLESILSKHSDESLHPNHYLLFNIQYDIIQRINFFYSLLSGASVLPLAERQVELCRICLALVSIIWPGFQKLRGRLLYLLQQGLNEKVKIMKERTGRRVYGQLQALTDEVKTCRQEICKILQDFPVGSDENMIAKQMAKNLNGPGSAGEECDEDVTAAMIKMLMGL